MKTISLCLLAFVLITCKPKSFNDKNLPSVDTSKPVSTIESVSTIAFGSCNDEDNDQSYWKEILKNTPELWIWGGDNIYGDTKDMSILKAKYDRQKNNVHYKEFIRSTVVVGTWDDHDYGINDGNKMYEKKKESKHLLLDFLDVPAAAVSRRREGIYQSYLIGEIGKQVKILLLDTRYFQDVLKKDNSGKARYLPSLNGDLLGEAQWQWLEEELYKNEAEVHIIMSSIQFAADKHGFEKWGNFPKSKQKMFDIIHYSHANNVMFLSGDRHIGEISRLAIDSLDYPLYDITSSGLTHSYEKSKEVNPYRVGDLVVNKNYGVLRFDWKESSVNINCQIKGVNGEIYVNEDLGNFSF